MEKTDLPWNIMLEKKKGQSIIDKEIKRKQDALNKEMKIKQAAIDAELKRLITELDELMSDKKFVWQTHAEEEDKEEDEEDE